MNNTEQCDAFIKLLEQKKASVKIDSSILYDLLQSLLSIIVRYYDDNNIFVKKTQELFHNSAQLRNSKQNSNPYLHRCNASDIAADTISMIESVIDEVKAIGLPQHNTSKATKDINITNTLNQNQSQSQEQTVVEQIFIEAIKDELTGKQRKELLAIAHEADTPQEAHKGILAKLKDFGVDVSANIIANILTNPSIWTSIGSIL